MKESNSIDIKKERIRLSRIGVLNSHLSSDPMASEKEAALAAVPSDSPTMYCIYFYYFHAVNIIQIQIQIQYYSDFFFLTFLFRFWCKGIDLLLLGHFSKLNK